MSTDNRLEPRVVFWGALVICAGLIFLFGQLWLEYQAQTAILERVPHTFIPLKPVVGAYYIGVLVVAVGASLMVCGVLSQGRSTGASKRDHGDEA